MARIDVKGTSVTVYSDKDMDFISLTEMLKAKDGDFFISDWLRNRNTVEFLGIWEQMHNPDFNYGEFAAIKSLAGLHSYKISVKEWVAKTRAIGLVAEAGRYGGTYAHKDIAFEFGMWISPEFKIYLIKEFQRIKEAEAQQLGWDIRRNLTRINYRIHTDAIKANLVPPELSPQQINFIYASEADLLNMALFGRTAKQWRDENPGKQGQYPRRSQCRPPGVPGQSRNPECAFHPAGSAAGRAAAPAKPDSHWANETAYGGYRGAKAGQGEQMTRRPQAELGQQPVGQTPWRHTCLPGSDQIEREVQGGDA